MSLVILIFAPVFLLWLWAGVSLARKKRWVALGLLIVFTGSGAVWMLRPVCVPIENSEEEARKYHYATRKDRDFYVKVFQKKDNQWHHCKTWLSRQFFF